MTIALELQGVTDILRAAPAPKPKRRSHRLLKRVLLAFGAVVFSLVAAVGTFMGITLYRIDHAVHHVALSPALLAQGQNDLLAVVKGPKGHEEIYVFRTTSGHANVLSVPSTLSVRSSNGGAKVPLSSLNIHEPAAMVRDLRAMGIPIGHYVGVDLHAANPNSQLGRLALGTLSVTSLLSNPAAASGLIASVASHVYLGPHTSVSALLSLMHVQSSTTLSMPTSTLSDGTVVLATAAMDVLRHFL
ncbi:MAG TPA: hypothetical protein VNG12_21020 [Acidimicrobiales bacterium]|nr:hypothetical protein [Acidimicrobiales bacterium]